MDVTFKRMIGKVRSVAARYASDARGSVAIWFGIAAPVVAVAALGVVDYGNASMKQTLIQNALDDAALIAARSTATTSAQIDAIGDAAFAGLLPTGTPISGFTPDSSGHIANVTFTLTGTTVSATAVGTVTPLVSNLLLGGPVPIHAKSEVVRGMNQLEIALVLDNTGSMQGSKISNLITAANNFVTTMQNATVGSTVTDPVKISIVPFSVSVKVNPSLSMATYNTSTFSMTNLPTWLDGRARALAWNNDIFTNASSASARIDRFAMLKSLGKTWDGCVEARVAPYDIRDTAPTSSNVSTLFIPYFWPDEPDTDTDYMNDYTNDVSNSGTWSVRQGYSAKYTSGNIKASGNISGLGYTYGPNAGCVMAPIMRLTTDFTALHNEINTMTAGGDTDIPLGLMWGWHTISPNAPFGDGSAYGAPHVTKIIVLMTDGENTFGDVNNNNNNNSLYEGYGYVWQNRLGSTNLNTAASNMDARMVPPTGTTAESLCGNIKAQNIQIYTVGVGVTTASKALLTACATSSDNYYDVTSNGSNLNATFAAIAGSIQNLRISK